MRDMHREFHSLRAQPGEGEPEFVNDTTRKLDASVEEARVEALRGGWERALRALDEAKAYGRPRAAGLGDQIRRLLGQTSSVYFTGLVTDRRYASELLPPLVAEHAAHSYRDDSTLTFHLRGADEHLVALAYATLEQVRGGTHRYTAAGPFGEAVDRARDLARWGDTDGAWRVLRDALPSWEPSGPDLLAPLGWLADPVLGPVMTPERGRELLSTPRGGHAGKAPGPTAGLDPDDLAWLAEPDPGNNRTSYRFVLVEGVEPEELPTRLADGEDAVLNEPMTLWDARHRLLHNRRGVLVRRGQGPHGGRSGRRRLEFRLRRRARRVRLAAVRLPRPGRRRRHPRGGGVERPRDARRGAVLPLLGGTERHRAAHSPTWTRGPTQRKMPLALEPSRYPNIQRAPNGTVATGSGVRGVRCASCRVMRLCTGGCPHSRPAPGRVPPANGETYVVIRMALRCRMSGGQRADLTGQNRHSGAWKGVHDAGGQERPVLSARTTSCEQLPIGPRTWKTGQVLESGCGAAGAPARRRPLGWRSLR